jgi:hypothetical protein
MLKRSLSDNLGFDSTRKPYFGEPLWLSGKVVKNEKINEIVRTRVRSPPQATSFLKKKAIFLHLLSLGELRPELIRNLNSRPTTGSKIRELSTSPELRVPSTRALLRYGLD